MGQCENFLNPCHFLRLEESAAIYSLEAFSFISFLSSSYAPKNKSYYGFHSLKFRRSWENISFTSTCCCLDRDVVILIRQHLQTMPVSTLEINLIIGWITWMPFQENFHTEFIIYNFILFYGIHLICTLFYRISLNISSVWQYFRKYVKHFIKW